MDVRDRAATQGEVKIGADAVNFVMLLDEALEKRSSQERVQNEGGMSAIETVAGKWGGAVVHISAIAEEDGGRRCSGSEGKGEKNTVERENEVLLWTIILIFSSFRGSEGPFSSLLKSISQLLPDFLLTASGRRDKYPCILMQAML